MIHNMKTILSGCNFSILKFLSFTDYTALKSNNRNCYDLCAYLWRRFIKSFEEFLRFRTQFSVENSITQSGSKCLIQVRAINVILLQFRYLLCTDKETGSARAKTTICIGRQYITVVTPVSYLFFMCSERKLSVHFLLCDRQIDRNASEVLSFLERICIRLPEFIGKIAYICYEYTMHECSHHGNNCETK